MKNQITGAQAKEYRKSIGTINEQLDSLAAVSEYMAKNNVPESVRKQFAAVAVKQMASIRADVAKIKAVYDSTVKH
jgi:hypothetical protein